jgi:sugar/nucleoside kinase (ribokinase family)
MSNIQFLDFLVVGEINNEFIVDIKNRSHENVLGGSALYTAGGCRCWSERVGIVSHCSAAHHSKIYRIHDRYQIDVEGIHFDDQKIDDRLFFGYSSIHDFVTENPVAFYSSRKMPFPKDLLGYQKKSSENNLPEKTKYLPEDIPPHYWDSAAVLICSTDIFTQLQVSSALLNAGIKTVVIQSSPEYMKLPNYDLLPGLMKDLNTFITTIPQLTELFHNRLSNFWEMAEFLAGLGCDHIVINDGNLGFYLYDRGTNSKFQIPVYPSELIDPTGILDAFSGGFMAGIKDNYDPLEALVFGSVSASFTSEGVNPFYGVDAMPELRNSRVNFARQLVKRL